ncbi:hypothetical protein KARMA_3280 [Donghicola eburneus]|uniref:Glycosyl transferase n=1 Tax=Donghicola eburneus TaxID=393278 RepID=A0A1M4N4Q5_9RHOB|nr:hypothetical protein KARMA_3280 [Donghicola eburneus]
MDAFYWIVEHMSRIAFILLCHKDPKAIIDQAERLTAVGDYISIHFDARAKPEHFAMIKEALGPNPNVAFAKKRIKCGWGEWSLVEASLYAVEAATEAFPRATHFYMLSGDCMSVKTAEYAHEFLDSNDCDFIESFDFFSSDWIKTGIKEERLEVVPVFRPVCRLAKLQLWFHIMRRSLGSGVEYHRPRPASAAHAMSAGVFRCNS